MKALFPEGNVHYLAGLPIVSTSPDMSPRYDIAGQGKADATAMRNAIYLAIDGFRARQEFDAPYANPLQKIYKERKDDSEKVRFAIPKKHSFHKDGDKERKEGGRPNTAPADAAPAKE